MRTTEAFVLGAIVGAAVTGLWGRKIEEYVEAKAGKALDRADALLQDTKQHVRKTLRAGRAAIRPAPAATNG